MRFLPLAAFVFTGFLEAFFFGELAINLESRLELLGRERRLT